MAIYDLQPGSYTLEVTVTNVSKYTDGSYAPAILTLELGSTNTIVFPAQSAQLEMEAHEVMTATYDFIITEAMTGQVTDVTASIKDPQQNLLDSKSLTIAVALPAPVIGLLNLLTLSKEGESSPAGTPLPLETGEAFWATLELEHQYKGGNFTVTANFGASLGSSSVDITLPDSVTMVKENVITTNTVLFTPTGLADGSLLPLYVAVIFRGYDEDWSQSTVVASQTFNNAAEVVIPEQEIIYSATVELGTVEETTPVTGGAEINPGTVYFLGNGQNTGYIDIVDGQEFDSGGGMTLYPAPFWTNVSGVQFTGEMRLKCQKPDETTVTLYPTVEGGNVKTVAAGAGSTLVYFLSILAEATGNYIFTAEVYEGTVLKGTKTWTLKGV